MVFPVQRHAIDVTLIQREYLLPEGAIGSVEVQTGMRVDLRDVVARCDALGVVVRGDRRLAARRFERLLTRLVGDRHRGAGPRLPV